MLMAILYISWKDQPTNTLLYGRFKKIMDIIKERRLRFAGYTLQKKELASYLLLWAPSHGICSIGRPHRTYVNQLIEYLEFENRLLIKVK